MSEQATTKNLIDITEKAVVTFNEGVEGTQTSILRKVNSVLRELELNAEGNIKPNSKNLRLTRELRANIKKIIVDPAYIKKVDKYLGTFDKLKRELDKNFKAPDFNPNRTVYKDTLNFNIDLTKESLISSGIDQNVAKPVIDVVNQGITSGSSIKDLEDQVRLLIKGNEARLGTLERYTKQITRDALNQYSANYNKTISIDLGLDWYFYSGSLIEDSRSYCVERAGKYFHKKEVQDVPSAWSGMIPGTDSSSIFVWRGGYNCRHMYLAVTIDVVPESVISRNIANGNYTPKAA